MVVILLLDKHIVSSYVALLKTDEHGDSLWTKKYECYELKYIDETSDRGFIMVGSWGRYDNGDIIVYRTDDMGDTLWSIMYNGGWDEMGPYIDNGGSVIQTEDGSFIVSGVTEDDCGVLFQRPLDKLAKM
jgi:hypothetical protein